MTPFEEEIDEILDQHEYEVRQLNLNDFSGIGEVRASTEQAIKLAVSTHIIKEDVEHTKWFKDMTDEYDYYYTVKRPMAIKHQNELRAEQRQALGDKHE